MAKVLKGAVVGFVRLADTQCGSRRSHHDSSLRIPPLAISNRKWKLIEHEISRRLDIFKYMSKGCLQNK